MDHHLRRSIDRRNRQALLFKKRDVFDHSPFCFIEAIFDGTANPAESFEFGGIKAKKTGVVGRLDGQRIAKVNHWGASNRRPLELHGTFRSEPLLSHDNRYGSAGSSPV